MGHQLRIVQALVVLAAIGLYVLVPDARAQSPRERKNIDALPALELSAYKHALSLLRNGPPGKNYQHFADLHDVFAPDHGCEHQNELFFPWHRSLLYYFEQAIQATDPGGTSGPSTRDVMIPYWDWTVAPTGVRYSKPFEEAGSPLAYDFRISEPLTQPMFPKSTIFQIVKNTTSWPGFAGGPKSSPFFGAIEQPAHNAMHSEYVGGDMGNPTTAAEDPIFWSFHAYIDLIWDRWQRIHQIEPTCSNCPLRGLPSEKTPKDLIHVEEQLGYFYRENRGVTPTVAFATSDQSPKPRVFDLSPTGAGAADFAATAEYRGTKPHTFRLEIPKEPFRTARLLLLGVKVPTTISYRGDIYLHEKRLTYDAVKKDTKNPPVGRISVWVGHAGTGEAAGHEHSDRPAIYTDITDRVRDLARDHAGEEWAVTVALEPVPMKSQRAGKAPTTLPADQEIQFHGMRLVLDGTYAASERDLKPAASEKEP